MMKKAIKVSALLILITLSYQCKQKKAESAKEGAVQTSKVKKMSEAVLVLWFIQAMISRVTIIGWGLISILLSEERQRA